jgi:hypothetical protein
MNQRIQELALQAELPVIDGEWDYNDREILRREDGEWRVATPAEIISLLFACEKGREKFAALIVRECRKYLESEAERLYALSAQESNPNFQSNFEICAEKCYDNIQGLKEHFGVER